MSANRTSWLSSLFFVVSRVARVVAPKKAALKEAEAELAVAMEVSFFYSCSQVFILSLTCYCADFPMIAQELRRARVLKAVPSLRLKGIKGTKNKQKRRCRRSLFPLLAWFSRSLAPEFPFNSCHAGFMFIFRTLERVRNLEINVCAVIFLLCHVVFAKSVILSVQKFGFSLIRRELVHR